VALASDPRRSRHCRRRRDGGGRHPSRRPLSQLRTARQRAAGIAVLFLSVYAGFNLYSLFGPQIRVRSFSLR
jgi:hypothetical protein